jgi:hypothetical protein
MNRAHPRGIGIVASPGRVLGCHALDRRPRHQVTAKRGIPHVPAIGGVDAVPGAWRGDTPPALDPVEPCAWTAALCPLSAVPGLADGDGRRHPDVSGNVTPLLRVVHECHGV